MHRIRIRIDITRVLRRLFRRIMICCARLLRRLLGHRRLLRREHRLRSPGLYCKSGTRTLRASLLRRGRMYVLVLTFLDACSLFDHSQKLSFFRKAVSPQPMGPVVEEARHGHGSRPREPRSPTDTPSSESASSPSPPPPPPPPHQSSMSRPDFKRAMSSGVIGIRVESPVSVSRSWQRV